MGLWIIYQDRFIVSKDICRKINGDTHHTKFVLQSSYIFTAFFHCDEIWAKGACFYQALEFREPVDRIIIEKDDETSAWALSGEFTSMIRVNKSPHCKTNTTTFWNSGRDLFRAFSISARTQIFKRGNRDSSILGSDGSKTSELLWLIRRYANMW